MMKFVIPLLAGLLPALPILFFRLRRRHPEYFNRRFVIGLSSFNLLVGVMVIGAGVIWFFAPGTVRAAGLPQAGGGTEPMAYLAAGIAVGLGSIGAAMAVSTVGSAAIGAIAENAEMFGRALIFVGLAEGVAIYGLIIAFIMLQ
jgi:V/A-type H+-transporting ATPase subunit K